MDAHESWRKEMSSVFIYRAIAESETTPAHRALFDKLAADAEAQAQIWAKHMRAAGQAVPAAFAPGLRERVVAALVRRLGARRLRPVLAAMKVRGMSVFTAVLSGHPLPTSAAEIGQRHRSAAGGNLRALVFGANDGLVSNAGLILGVVGATGGGEGRTVVISGIAGLLAGAFSMASGEYVSVRSQREMFEHQIAAERDELEAYPEAEAAELATIYEARGLSRDDATRMAGSIIKNPAYALDALAREELALDPADLGSPWAAAGSSFVSFSLGALVPLLPFLLARGRHALLASLAVTAVALFAIGAAISLFTGRKSLLGGLRVLLIGAAAAGATYLIGRLLDVAVS